MRAASLEEAIAHFTADNYGETDAGIGAVAASGDSALGFPHRSASRRPIVVQRRAEPGVSSRTPTASYSMRPRRDSLLQTPKEVTMIFDGDMQVRRV